MAIVLLALCLQDWPQDAHDAQRTGWTLEEPALPWTLAWTSNGPDESVASRFAKAAFNVAPAYEAGASMRGRTTARSTSRRPAASWRRRRPRVRPHGRTTAALARVTYDAGSAPHTLPA